MKEVLHFKLTTAFTSLCYNDAVHFPKGST